MKAFWILFLWELRESFGIDSPKKKSRRPFSWWKVAVSQSLLMAFFAFLFTFIFSEPRLLLEAAGRPGLFAAISILLTGFLLVLGALAQAILNWDWGGDRAWIMTQPLPTPYLFLSKILAAGTMLTVNAAGVLFHWTLLPDGGISKPTLGLVFATALAASLGVSSLAHILLTLGMSVGRRILSKDKLMVVLAVLGIVGGIGIHIILSSAMDSLRPESISDWLANWGVWLAPLEDFLSRVPLWLVWVLAPVLLAVALPLSGLYVRGIAGDTGKGSGSASPKPARVSGLFSREFFLLMREPTYLLNGPLILYILPLVIWVIAGFNSAEVLGSLAAFRQAPPMVREFFPLSMAGFALFVGVFSGMAASAVSREGNGLAWLKSLPLDIKRLLRVKWLLAMAFFGGALFLTYLPTSILGLTVGLYGFPIWLLTLTAVCGLGGLFNALSLFLDATRPYLTWDQPVTAVKANVNVLIQFLALMVLLVGLGFLTLVFSENAVLYLALLNALGWGGLALCAGPGLAWASRRLKAVPV